MAIDPMARNSVLSISLLVFVASPSLIAAQRGPSASLQGHAAKLKDDVDALSRFRSDLGTRVGRAPLQVIDNEIKSKQVSLTSIDAKVKQADAHEMDIADLTDMRDKMQGRVGNDLLSISDEEFKSKNLAPAKPSAPWAFDPGSTGLSEDRNPSLRNSFGGPTESPFLSSQDRITSVMKAAASPRPISPPMPDAKHSATPLAPSSASVPGTRSAASPPASTSTQPTEAADAADSPAGDPGQGAAAAAPASSDVSLSPASLSFASPTQSVTLTNKGKSTLSVSNIQISGANAGDFNKSSDNCTGASLNSGTSCTISLTFAPTSSGTRTATLTITDSATGGTQTVALTGGGSPSRKEWEARAIVGFHQAGASSANFTQNFFFDFFVERALSKNSLPQARANLWGEVRIASTPQQITAPVSTFVTGFGSQVSQLPVNQLAQSAEFQSGLEFQLKVWDRGVNGYRTLGLVPYFGAMGTFQPPSNAVQIFDVPSTQSPQYALFAREFPSAANSKYIGFAPPDRQRFYRQYGLGVRVTTYDNKYPINPPGIYMFSLGQDESVTGGVLRSLVGRFDVFYPLPLQSAKLYKFIYLFGTVNLRLSRATNLQPLVLQNPNANGITVNAYDPDVAIVTVRSNRDTYKIGVGVDLLALFDAIGEDTSKKSQASTPAK